MSVTSDIAADSRLGHDRRPPARALPQQPRASHLAPQCVSPLAPSLIWRLTVDLVDAVYFTVSLLNQPTAIDPLTVYAQVNYGQYFTWSDRQGGSYMHPDHKFDPLLQVKDEKKVE